MDTGIVKKEFCHCSRYLDNAELYGGFSGPDGGLRCPNDSIVDILLF